MDEQQQSGPATIDNPNAGDASASDSTGEGKRDGNDGDGGGDSATATAVQPRTRPAPPRVDHLPPWKVLLHNDDHNEVGYVVETIIELLSVNPAQALLQTLEAHKSGLALLVTTHRERAELLCEQFASKRLTVTIEPDR
jgi:ATP-dependent Clp protease adaptor protein ClpS